MKPKKLIPAARLAWLNEIGVDTHWLGNAEAAKKPVIATGRHGDTGRISAKGVAANVAAAASAAQDTSIATAGSATVGGKAARTREKADITQRTGRGSLPDISGLDSLDKLNNAILEYIQSADDAARPVLGAGVNTRPRYMLIGEQPGLDDSVAGKPFSGDQGKLLAAIFGSVRLPEAESCYMTHLVKYRLVNDISSETELLAESLQFLQQEIALLQPQNIIAMGSVAAGALLGTNDLKDLRGQMHYYQLAGNKIPLWISHQPVALLVHGARKEQTWRDFVAIARHNGL